MTIEEIQEHYSIKKDGTVIKINNGRTISHLIDKCNNNYVTVQFHINGKACKKYLHKILAEIYVPNPSNYTCVTHIDKDKLNNDLSNLKWIPAPNQQITKETIDNIIKDFYTGQYSLIEVAERNNVSKYTVQKYTTKHFSEKSVTL